jgi:hypothetical protein
MARASRDMVVCALAGIFVGLERFAVGLERFTAALDTTCSLVSRDR